jgi:hypothetical protein
MSSVHVKPEAVRYRMRLAVKCSDSCFKKKAPSEETPASHVMSQVESQTRRPHRMSCHARTVVVVVRVAPSSHREALGCQINTVQSTNHKTRASDSPCVAMALCVVCCSRQRVLRPSCTVGAVHGERKDELVAAGTVACVIQSNEQHTSIVQVL